MEALDGSQLAALRDRAGEADGIRYAYLFGSCARGTAHRHSDVDLAVSGLSVDDRLRLQADVERLTGRRAQVVSFERASPALRHRILREGLLLVHRDPRARTAEAAGAIIEYLDLRANEQRLVAGVLRAAAEGR